MLSARWCCLFAGLLRFRAGSLGLLAFQVLQAQLQLHDPLLLIVRAELAGMSYQLLCAVSLQ